MKIYRNYKIYQHDIQIGNMVGTKHICFARLRLEMTLYTVSDSNTIQDQVSPNFFQFKNQRKPAFFEQQDVKERKQKYEPYKCIEEEQDSPNPS